VKPFFDVTSDPHDSLVCLPAESGFGLVPILVSIDRTGDPATREGLLLFEFTYTYLGLQFAVEPIHINFEVLPPVLSVSPTIFNIPGGADSDSLTIRNDGQGTIFWNIDTGEAGYPDWLSLTNTIGELTEGQSDPVELQINRALMVPGTYDGYFTIVADDLEQRVDVSITVL